MISGEGKLFTLVRCDSDEEWCEERRKGIGGSDVAAIMGLSAYRTPYQVWLDKTLGSTDDVSDKPAVMWGNILEHIIGEHYAEQHPDCTVRRVNGMLRSIERPWAQASLDYEVRDPELGWGVLECKTAGWRREDDWSEGVPVYYQTQVAHYLSVSGRDFADVAVLIAGQDYREFRVMRDPEDVRLVDSAVDTFWHENVEKGVEPDLLPSDSTKVINEFPIPLEGGDGFVTFGSAPRELTCFLRAKEARDIYDKEMRLHAANLKLMVGETKGLSCPDGVLRWRRGTRESFDKARFKADHPDLYESYVVEKPSDGGLFWKGARK